MKERAFALALIGGVAAILLAVGWVLIYERLDPSPPSLRDDPRLEIPGEVLYINEKGCIIVAAASGETRDELICPVNLDAAGWTEDGRVLYSTWPAQPSDRSANWWVYDPVTGETEELDINRQSFEVFEPRGDDSPSGQTVSVNSDGDVVVSTTPTESRVVYEFDGADSWYPEFMTWSPDGEYILMWYGADEELWIIASDGDFAGTLAGDVRWSRPISWRIEGLGYLPSRRASPGVPD